MMTKLVIPIRYSILALLSARKATIFSEDLLNLMKKVLNY